MGSLAIFYTLPTLSARFDPLTVVRRTIIPQCSL
jgi:hypothetical protein